MTAGDIYPVAGSPAGYEPNFTGTANGTPASQSRLNHPSGVAVNLAGLYIAHTPDCPVVEFPAAHQTQWGHAMTADLEHTIPRATTTRRTGGRHTLATPS